LTDVFAYIECPNGLKVKYLKGTPLIDRTKIKKNPINVKTHPKSQIEGIAQSIKTIGFLYPIGVDAKSLLWAGHGRVLAAELLEMPFVPYAPWDDLTEEQKHAMMLIDNRLNESEWDIKNVEFVMDKIPKFDFKPFKLNFNDLVAPKLPREEEPWIEKPEEPKAKLGDLYKLGEHYLMCGDATLPDHQKKLLGDLEEIDIIITDPPYSSGGFQEAGKHQGSIGTQRKDEKTGKQYTPKIRMDDLSTRGYVTLIRSMLFGLFTHNLYIFTDWKMWDWTCEAIESSGYQKRNMIVWDKLTPGLGIQWRGQHELIAFGRSKETVVPD